ncbi:MAG: 4-hydroxy-tetrahydrodipicolinate reductase [Phycisphaerales bacterium]|nr:MAG: 4-hydroxy-tetrahydrodipicolinate reductase [Phycisphaerales bacterium]
MIRLTIFGARGRMGRRVCTLARADARFDLVAEVDLVGPDAPHAAPDAPSSSPCDAVIDFSTDAGTLQAARHALQHGAALLVGTTGLTAQTLKNLELASRSLPLLIAPNTSLGVALCNHAIAEIARRLGRGFDVDIIEKHHAGKRDAPSGTALRFMETLRSRAGIDLPDRRVHSVRSGDIVGQHAIEFTGRGEQIKIEHVVTNRDVFARGALNAVAWLCGREPGRYTIEQYLDLPP